MLGWSINGDGFVGYPWIWPKFGAKKGLEMRLGSDRDSERGLIDNLWINALSRDDIDRI